MVGSATGLQVAQRVGLVTILGRQHEHVVQQTHEGQNNCEDLVTQCDARLLDTTLEHDVQCAASRCLLEVGGFGGVPHLGGVGAQGQVSTDRHSSGSFQKHKIN